MIVKKKSRLANSAVSDILQQLTNIYRRIIVRTCIAIMLSVVAIVSLATAGDSLPDPETKPFLERIAATSFEFSADPKKYLPDYEPDQKYFIDVSDIKRWRGFKLTATVYWFYAAARTHKRNGGFKFKTYLGKEPDANVSFGMANGNRAIFVADKFPVILFPWGTKHRIDRVVAIIVTGKGVAISYAFTIGPRPVPLSKISRKKEGKRN